MAAIEDTEYFKRREAAERKLAAVSCEPQTAKIHLEMAERYAEKSAAFEARSTLRIVV